MKLSLEALLTLDAIARAGSFAGAAEELNRVRSAVTYTVQKLEQDLGVALFDRNGHRARLTAAGEELLQEGRVILGAARRAESRVRKMAAGWESDLRIAVSDIIAPARLYPLVAAFGAEQQTTRVRLLTEVLGGCWDALVDRRADLAVGAPGDLPPGGSFATHPLGPVEFVFAVAPHHPLAAAARPLRRADILAWRSVSAADSSRLLPPRTSGLLDGQDVLTVPDMSAKIAAQRAGLGVGYVPAALVEQEVRDGSLITKAVEEPKPAIPLYLAWRADQTGKALQWFVERLKERSLAQLLSVIP